MARYIPIFLLLVFSQSARADLTVFSDDFNSENGMAEAIDFTNFTNWVVSDGSVDLLYDGDAHDFFPQTDDGGFLDMDGSGSAGGGRIVSAAFDLPETEPGCDYHLEFDLGNSDNRFGPEGVSDFSNTMEVSVVSSDGTTLSSETYSLSGLQELEAVAPQTFSLADFTAPVTASIVFDHSISDADRLGLLIDDVNLSCKCSEASDISIVEFQEVVFAGTNDVGLDRDGDGDVDSADLVVFVREDKSTWIGDSNLDGEFNSSDMVTVFQAGQYEDGVDTNSTWTEGDWNSDQEFDSGDLVLAFQGGGFELGPRRPAVVAVPEPASWVLIGMCLLSFGLRRRRH